MIINLSQLRQQVRALMKANMPQALMVTLVASIPSLLLQMAMTMSQAPLMTALQEYMYTPMSERNAAVMFENFLSGLSQSARVLWILAPLSFLLLPFLTIGWSYFSLRMVRGMSCQVTDVFARVNCFFKAILLQILLFLVILLWSLPGLAIMWGGALLAMWQKNVNMLSIFYFIGMVVTTVMMIRAYLRYGLSSIRMADHPEEKPLQCLKWSGRVMKKMGMGLFMLLIPFLIFTLLGDLLTSLLSGVFVLAIVVSLALSLFISCYMRAVICRFYDVMREMDEKIQRQQKENAAAT